MTMEVIIKGRTPLEPKDRVLAVEMAVEAICREVGQDPADAVMALLVAAVHIASERTRHLSMDAMCRMMSESLGGAIVAADGFFDLRLGHLKPTEKDDGHGRG